MGFWDSSFFLKSRPKGPQLLEEQKHLPLPEVWTIAVSQGHTQIVRSLMKNKITLECLKNMQSVHSLLDMAAEKGHTSILLSIVHSLGETDV